MNVQTTAIRAVIFDYGGVLMRTADPTPRRTLERRLGLAPGEVYEVVFGSPAWQELQLGRLSSAEFWSSVGERLGLDEAGVADFRATFHAGDRLDEGLVALIRDLRVARDPQVAQSGGYRTALLSNAPASLERRLVELGIDDAFDEIVISGREGVMKPDAEIFERALGRLDVRAEEALFVDDFRENVAAARRVGLQAVRFLGPTPLRQQLRRLGVAVPEPDLTPLPDVRAVIFDWGGVMEPLTDDAHDAAWAQRLGVEPGTLMEAMWGQAWRQFSIGGISSEAYYQQVAEGLGFPSAEAAERFADEFYAVKRLNPTVLAAARNLRARYRVALLSNAWPGQAEHVRETFGVDVHADFDVYVNSAEVGLRKPNPAIFRLTLERLDVAPRQAAFLDDLIRNVDAAREVGIHALQFVDPETSLAMLATLLGEDVENEF
ncbi:MAG TPA: HAD family phosphatase [Chloroflexi bacterium]|nr:HAD family phosphatase [Chloroflexota bacterium]